MSIKQAQCITSATLKAIDDSIWREVAIKAITKMPRIQLTNQSNKLIHDFALMNGHDPKHFLHNISQQDEKKQTFIDNLFVGGIKQKAAHRKLSQGDLIFSQNLKKKQENFNFRITNRSFTQTDSFIAKSNAPRICTQLFVSEIPNEQEQIIEGLLRKTKAQNIRYNQKLQQVNRQRLAKSQQHSQNQRKKLKEAKHFTYDYEGKLVGTKFKQNGNIKFVHIKAKFNQNHGKQSKSFIESLHKAKHSHITQKRIIMGDDYGQTEVIRQQRNSKNIPLNLNNSFNDLFKDDRSIQMGVSIVDKATNSKFVNNNRENAMSKSIKLSDFKKSFKSSSIVARAKKEKMATVQSNSPNLSEKDLIRVKTVSDAQSKILSSAFSRYSKQLGKISINNNKAFMESFYNDNERS